MSQFFAALLTLFSSDAKLVSMVSARTEKSVVYCTNCFSGLAEEFATIANSAPALDLWTGLLYRSGVGRGVLSF